MPGAAGIGRNSSSGRDAIEAAAVALAEPTTVAL